MEAIFLPRTDICFTKGEDLFGIPPKEGKTYENKNDFLFIDEKSN